jgi:CRISPR-associated endoribonuclease Cas6
MSFVALMIHLQPAPSSRACSEEVERVGDVGDAPLLQAVQGALLVLGGKPRSFQECGADQAPFALSLLPGESRRVSLRVTTLGEAGCASIPLLLDALAAHPPFQIGMCHYTVEAVDLSRSAWAGLATWADFLAPPDARTIRLHLGTPLVLSPGAGTLERRVFHFPSPRPIFAELAQRWDLLDGPPLPVGSLALAPLLEDGSIVVADHRLRSTPVLLDGRTQLGLVGWVCYECRAQAPAARATLAALARFAFFAGVGGATSLGMGAVRATIA